MPRPKKEKKYSQAYSKKDVLELRKAVISISIQITTKGVRHLSTSQQQRLVGQVLVSLRSLYVQKRLVLHSIQSVSMGDSQKILGRCLFQMKDVSFYQQIVHKLRQE